MFLFLILLATNFSFTLAQRSINATDARSAIDLAKIDMQEMMDSGFSIIRINDTIAEATNYYDAQKALEEKTGQGDYSTVISLTDKISSIKKEAFDTYDELSALKKKLDESSQKQDAAEAEAIYNEAMQEFKDERYAQANDKIEECYAKIIELQAAFTRVKAIYEASTKTIAGFFSRNYVTILIVLGVLLVLYIALRRRIYRAIIRRKIRKLELEKEILNDLIRKAQEEYFKKGAISEGNYRIRVTKFAELIRDINRQIPIMTMKLEKETELKKAMADRENKKFEEKKREEEMRKKIQGKKEEETIKLKKAGEAEKSEKERVERLKSMLEKHIKEKRKGKSFVSKFFENMKIKSEQKKIKKLEEARRKEEEKKKKIEEKKGTEEARKKAEETKKKAEEEKKKKIETAKETKEHKKSWLAGWFKAKKSKGEEQKKAKETEKKRIDEAKKREGEEAKKRAEEERRRAKEMEKKRVEAVKAHKKSWFAKFMESRKKKSEENKMAGEIAKKAKEAKIKAEEERKKREELREKENKKRAEDNKRREAEEARKRAEEERKRAKEMEKKRVEAVKAHKKSWFAKFMESRKKKSEENKAKKEEERKKADKLKSLKREQEDELKGKLQKKKELEQKREELERKKKELMERLAKIKSQK